MGRSVKSNCEPTQNRSVCAKMRYNSDGKGKQK